MRACTRRKIIQHRGVIDSQKVRVLIIQYEALKLAFEVFGVANKKNDSRSNIDHRYVNVACSRIDDGV